MTKLILAAATACFALLPASVLAAPKTDIIHTRGASVAASMDLSSGCVIKNVYVTASEQGYKETGNIKKDTFQAGFVQVQILNYDPCTGQGWFASGTTRTPAEFSASGAPVVGKPLTVSGSAINIPMEVSDYATGQSFTDNLTLAVSGTGTISNTKSQITQTTFLGPRPVKLTVHEDSDSGNTSVATISVTSTRFGALVANGPAAGTVARIKAGSLTLTRP